MSKRKFCVAIGMGRYDNEVNKGNPGPADGGSVARFCRRTCPVPF